MSDGSKAIKTFAWGVIALFALTAMIPSSLIPQFDALRIPKKSKRGPPPPPPVPTPEPTPVPTPVPPPAPKYPVQLPIESNFDVNAELLPANMAVSNAPDTVGAFRFICNAGQILADDPIVHPGQPGASHLHQFFGNTGANAHSTFKTLRTSGNSTCMSPLNRSAYWMPAMLDGKGNVVRPDYVSIYYKRWPSSSPYCTQRAKACTALPTGLRFIMGRNMLNLSQAPTGNFHFLCEGVGEFKDMGQALASCSPGKHIIAVIDAPMCWDGSNVDSADHRSHISYQIDTHLGYPACPTTHPYRIPVFTMSVAYTIAIGDDTKLWSLSSDHMAPGQPRGSTFHADWFGAWDESVMALWMENCVEKLLSCNSGNLGNGKQLKMFSGFSWTANPRLVPIAK